jgi:adenine-specific DNA methylase
MGLVVDKVSDYNSRQVMWEQVKKAVAHTFTQHAFPFRATFAEMPLTVSGGGLEWAIGNVLKATRQLAELPRAPHAQPATVSFGSATSLAEHPDGSITAVVVDPPYYDNVQYSELADYFYVWLSRTIGHLEPLWYLSDLCPNDDEGVANVEREKQKVRDRHGREPTAGEAKAAAHAYYEAVMRRTFAECRRVLRPDGVLTVMFTHTKQAAWVALATAIRDAGFTVTASWPVATESTTSLHIRDQNAAQSTVLLVARPRAAGAGTGLWAEVRPRIVAGARDAAARLEGEGIAGVDLLVGSFGPAIGAAAAFDRVQEATGDDVPFDRVIEVAAGAVGAWRVERLTARATGGGGATMGIDAVGRAVLVWWATFGRGTVGFDEALLLTRALGLDANALVAAGVAERQKGNLTLRTATERRRAQAATAADEPGAGGLVHPGDATYATPLDALHAMVQAAIDAAPLPRALQPRAPAPVVSEAGVGRARAIWNRLSGEQRLHAGTLLAALVAAAPPPARFGPGALDYPDFGLWRSLMVHLGLPDAPAWAAPTPPALNLPGFERPTATPRGRRRAG